MGPPADLKKALDYSTLANKSVLITGGASGLGALIAAECAKHQAHVTIADIKETEGKAYQQQLKGEGLEVNFVQTDVTDWSSLIAAFKSAIKYSHNSSIDVVVAVAGLFGAPFILPSEEPASLDHDPPPPPTTGPVFDVNIKGVYYTSKLAQHYFGLNTTSSSESKGKKSLIVMGSLLGYIQMPEVIDYPTSKWAVRGFFRETRGIMERLGYQMNLIAPSIMDTPMSKEFCEMFRAHDIPVGNPRDVVTAVIRCSIDESISGRALGVGATETFDLMDDREGGDGAAAVKKYLETEGKNYAEFFHV